MSELIDRDLAIQGIKELFSLGDCYCDEISIIGMLNILPSTKENIIHCKDCVYWLGDKDSIFGECNYYSRELNKRRVQSKNFFCADARTKS